MDDKRKKKPPLMPPARLKPISTPGSYYGCFSGNIEAMSTELRKVKPPKPPKRKPKPYPLTSPGKKGGYGYVDICLSKYPVHMPDPPKKKEITPSPYPPLVTAHCPQPYFDKNPYVSTVKEKKPGPIYVRPKPEPHIPVIWIPTGPAKWQGGCHDGCFDKFPAYKHSKYIPMYKINKPTMAPGGNFWPHSYSYKTKFTESPLNLKVDIGITPDNYKTYKPTYIKHLL